MKKINKLIKRMWHDLWEKNDCFYFFLLFSAVIANCVFSLTDDSNVVNRGMAVALFLKSIFWGFCISVSSIIITGLIFDIITQIIDYFKKIIKEEL